MNIYTRWIWPPAKRNGNTRRSRLRRRPVFAMGECTSATATGYSTAVPPARAAQPRQALAAQALDRAVLGAGRHAQALASAQGGHLDLGAAQRLGDGERHLDLDVVALALEGRRLGDVGDHVEVPGRSPARAGLALARQPHAAALAHPGRDVDPVALDGAHRTRAVTGRAGLLDDRARAPAARAGSRDREHPLALGLHAAPLAAGADLGRRAGLGAGSVAGGAGRLGGHGDRDLGPVDRLLEGDRDLGLQVAAALGGPLALGAPAARAPEQVGQDVAKGRGVESAAAKPAAGERPAGERPRAAVVLLALLGVAEHVVGLGDLLEARLRLLIAGVAIGVVLARELAVGLLDLIGRGLLVHPQGGVKVLAGGHRLAPRLARHHDPSGPDDALAQAIAGLVDLDDRAGGDAVHRALGHRLVQSGVKRLAPG